MSATAGINHDRWSTGLIGAVCIILSTAVAAVQLDPIAPPLSGFSVPVVPGLTSGSEPLVVNARMATVLGKALFWDMNVGSGGRACASCHYQAGADRRISSLQPSTGVARNVPSVIGAAFNVRNFWDGRASRHFNGRSPWGSRDHSAAIYRVVKGRVESVTVLFDHSALASQAMEPPLNQNEMAAGKTTFPQVARRLLRQRPLAGQAVHPEDSLLASWRHASGSGLGVSYADLIRQAFAPAYWDESLLTTGFDFGRPGDDAPSYTLMESNFSLFFGIALQLYQATLTADQTRFDAPRTPEGYPEGYTEQERRGLDLFNRAECDFCHSGPVFSAATDPIPRDGAGSLPPPGPVDRRVLRVDRATRTTFTPLIDVGFANIGVTPDRQDVGLGGQDPYGNPLSFAARYRAVLANPATPMTDPVSIRAADFTLGFRVGFSRVEMCPDQPVPRPEVVLAELAKPGQGRLPLAVRGSFKIPGLRNVELTRPYMHDGSLPTLKAVIDFYDQGGRVRNPEHFATFVFPQHFTRQQKADLLAFLLTLTDERVRLEQAPFDHPALTLPTGQRIAAVGRTGRIRRTTLP